MPSLYGSVSLRTGRVRGWLRSRNKPFVDPERDRPNTAEIDQTAAWVVGQSSTRAGVFGGMVGVGGAVSLPSEVIGLTVATMRMAQRLAVVYGFELESDRGRMALWRALAAGYEIDLPERGPLGMRASELPAVLTPGLVARSTEGTMVGSILRASAKMVGTRLIRYIPILSSSVAAVNARERMIDIGARMTVVLRGMADAPSLEGLEVAEAVEL